MAVKIYVDVLFLTNLLFDYILLCITAYISKVRVRPAVLL